MVGGNKGGRGGKRKGRGVGCKKLLKIVVHAIGM